MRIQVALLFLLSFSIQKEVKAQGCSDAGVCTIHSIKSGLTSASGLKATKNELSISTGFARGERGTNILTSQIEYSHRFKNDISITGKMNYYSIKGELASTNGPGDIFLSFEKGFSKGEKWKKSIFGGLKIPLDDANQKKNSLGLPMVYQPTLGTTDLLTGINISSSQWGFALAYQQPLTSNNKNSFLASEYPPGHTAMKYPSTNQFNRKSDLVARIVRNFNAKTRFTFQPGLLGIYHTGTDSYLDESGNKISIDGSEGLTINALLNLVFRPGKKSNITISSGTPLIVRSVRPDGLTRKFVLSLEYAFRF
jgi:hypothetical protein